MFLHRHPFDPFIPEQASKLIVGTLPPPRFSLGILKSDDVNFCYGSRDGLLWPVLDRIFQLNLTYDNSDEAIHQRMAFLRSRGVGICDIVESCKRNKIDASDLGMQDIALRNILGYLKKYPSIATLLFTGGNSKNGPEYLFRKHLKENNLTLELISNDIPRIHQFLISKHRVITTVSLTAPSGSANRAIGSLEIYKKRKMINPLYNTLDFRVEQYRPFF